MPQSKSSSASFADILKAAKAAKADAEKATRERFVDGTTYVQYLATRVKVDGVERYRFTPTRHWPSVVRGDAVVAFKNLTSAIIATAQVSQGCWDMGIAPESLETPTVTKGFGVHNRIWDVKPTPEITDMLALVCSFDGQEHVAFFKEKAAKKRLEATYRKVALAHEDEVELLLSSK